ncbi:hypothetical protein AALO_G00267530 [Alosa alosa]|uniref:polynucleotide adenylyltransferase n=1 Tax=Alosa alosa TaxID=278164 RepID=A0AAV6FLD1_9TELE|nr:cell surface glycoprotein 1-like [Alosa alosa]XP_048088125.1 cell surface glycoprotein 1-like [Alosa alosa]KAG5263688.1 hypothetical protein AALO_G00267530 [Alosa alosa]
MTDSRSDQRRFHNLTQEQLETLDQVLTEVIPIHGRGNFPTLEVRPKDIIHVVRDKLVAKEIKVRDVRLNGSTASHVLVKENGTSYKDLDIIFGVELPKQEDFQIIKEVVLSCLLDFLPQGVNKDKITALTMKEAYVQKMVKVFTEHDRWSLISLSNNSGKNVELKFVNSLRRQFEFSVDSFQIILDRMLESYLEAERRQAAEAQRAGAIAGAAVAGATVAGATVAGAPMAPPTTPPTQSEAPPAHTQPTEAELPPPATADTDTNPEPQQGMETAAAEPEAMLEVVENGVSDSASLSENEPMQEDGASSVATQASMESPEAAARHEKQEEEKEEEEEEEEDAQPQRQAETASSEEQPGSSQTEAVPMDETRGELSDNNKQSPDTQDRPEIATAEKDIDKASRAATKEKEEEEEEEEEEEKKRREPEAPVFLAQIKAEASDHEEWLSETEAADVAEDQVPKSEVKSEPMDVVEEASAKAVGDVCVASLASPVSSPSPCPFLTQATPDSYLEYPLPPPAKKNTRSSQMVILKHSSPKPPRKMSKKVAPQKASSSEKPATSPLTTLQASAAGPCKLLCPPKIDPTECVPMQVELAGAPTSCSESPSCASTASEAPRLPAFDLPTPALPAAVPSESRSASEEEKTHLPSQPCESLSPDANPHTHTQTHDASAHSQTHVQTHEREQTHTPAGRQSPSLHRDQNTQTEPLPLPLEVLLLQDVPRPIIQVNSQPFVQVDVPSPSSPSREPLPVQVLQSAPLQEPKMQPEALSGSLSQQTNNVPVATVATGAHPTPAMSEPHISGPPEVSDSPHTEPKPAETPSEVSHIGYAQQHADTPQPNPPQCICEVAELPMPSVSPTATMPLLVAEMPAETPVSPMWCPPGPIARLTEVPLPTSSTPAHPPPPPPPAPPSPPTREVLNVTVVAESMYGDFEQAMDHLRYRLIATRNPEEIRGGGLLKYSNLLVREFKPASETEIKTLERYMCSRFFIDFPDVNEQQRKIESYLRNHFIGEEKSKYDYLMTLRRVVDESTVCLMGHERRQTLNMITILALKVLGEQNIIPNTNNVTCFYQPAPYMADHNFSNYYIANGQSPVIYHPYPLHIHMQTGLV